jgi:hypothetical protein
MFGSGESHGVDIGIFADIESKLRKIEAHLQNYLGRLQKQLGDSQ